MQLFIHCKFLSICHHPQSKNILSFIEAGTACGASPKGLHIIAQYIAVG